jgi:predicted transcriptional regulator of viral defense system
MSAHLEQKSRRWIELGKSGGEGGIRTPGRSFGPYNGLAKFPVSQPVFGTKDLFSDEMPYFGATKRFLGLVVQLLCNPKGTTVLNMPTFSHRKMSRTPLLERLRILADESGVIRASDLKKHRIHHEILKRALDHKLLTRVDRGLYASTNSPDDLKRRIILACKRVPAGAVCLESALQFHGILPSTPGPVWMAVDRKARKPIVDGRQLRFVRFSGRALTQGLLNIRIEGVHVRVFSTAKTVADCLKYRNKIGIETAIRAFQSSVRLKKCSRERLAHFAEICRVGSLVRQIYALKRASGDS